MMNSEINLERKFFFFVPQQMCLYSMSHGEKDGIKRQFPHRDEYNITILLFYAFSQRHSVLMDNLIYYWVTKTCGRKKQNLPKLASMTD